MKVETFNSIETRIEASVKGTTTISVMATTPVTMVKKHRETKEPNPYLGAIKTHKMNGMIGFDYSNAVNNQAKREGKEERTVHARKWGELSESRLFVHHKGQSYLQMKVTSTTDVVYMFNGKVIEYAKLKPYMSVKKKSSTQSDLEKEIKIRDIKVSNLNAITMQKETFLLQADKEINRESIKTGSKVEETETAKA